MQAWQVNLGDASLTEPLVLCSQHTQGTPTRHAPNSAVATAAVLPVQRDSTRHAPSKPLYSVGMAAQGCPAAAAASCALKTAVSALHITVKLTQV